MIALTRRELRLLAYKREVKVKVKVKLYCRKVLRWSREDPISTAHRDPLYRPLPAITLTLVTHTYEPHDHDFIMSHTRNPSDDSYESLRNMP